MLNLKKNRKNVSSCKSSCHIRINKFLFWKNRKIHQILKEATLKIRSSFNETCVNVLLESTHSWFYDTPRIEIIRRESKYHQKINNKIKKKIKHPFGFESLKNSHKWNSVRIISFWLLWWVKREKKKWSGIKGKWEGRRWRKGKGFARFLIWK